MKTYTVKEISDALGTNQETVRRWIRAGKLQASQSTKKDGNEITEKSLIDFLKKNPKYSNIAAGSALLGGVFSALVPGVGPLLATLLTGHILSSDTLKNGQVNKESVRTVREITFNRFNFYTVRFYIIFDFHVIRCVVNGFQA